MYKQKNLWQQFCNVQLYEYWVALSRRVEWAARAAAMFILHYDVHTPPPSLSHLNCFYFPFSVDLMYSIIFLICQ